MAHDNLDPNEVALKYSVKVAEQSTFELNPLDELLPKIQVRRCGAIINLKASPKRLCWEAEENTEPFYAVTLKVDELAIGHRGTEGWSSSLVDDCFFVIRGECLKHVNLLELRVVSEMQFNIEEAKLARMAGKAIFERRDGSVTDAWPFPSMGGMGEAGSRGSDLIDIEDEGKFTVARARITYCPAIPDHNFSECLHSEVGLSESNFRRLVQACSSRRLSSVRMHGIAAAFSTSGEFGVPRDVLIPAESRLNYRIGTISLEYNI